METASFGIALIGLLIAIASLVTNGKENKPLRYAIGLTGLLMAAYFGQMGLTASQPHGPNTTIVVTVAAPNSEPVKPNAPSATSAASASACLSTPYISLGSSWNVFQTQTVTTANQTGTYSHCPPAPKIRHVDMWVDDELDKVKLFCPDPARNRDVKAQFQVIHRDEVPHFESGTLDVPSGCRIDFTVRDTAGRNLQLGFRVAEVR